MSDDISTMYQDGKRGLAYAMNEAMSELQRARLDGDRTGAAEAALKINDISIRDRNFDQLYHSARQPQQAQHQAAGRPVRFKDEYGNDRVTYLTDEQREVAHSIGGTVRGMSNEQREAEYAKQAQKYARQRADGSYRDDQGRVTR